LDYKIKIKLLNNKYFENNVDIMCSEETKIKTTFDTNLLSIPGYNYESEINTYKARVGCFIKAHINYFRRKDLAMSYACCLIQS
jgi:hypothetical protein